MASARHSRGSSGPRGPGGGVALGAALVGLGIAAGTVLALQSSGTSLSGSASCPNRVVLNVATSPELATPLTTMALDYSRRQIQVQGHCIQVAVSGQSSEQTATAFADGNGDVDGTPDVWVPESTAWTSLARATREGAAAVPASGPAVASSPTVIAMPRPMAQALGWPKTRPTWAGLIADEKSDTVWKQAGHPAWGPFTVGFAGPDASVASNDVLLQLAASVEKTGADKVTDAAFQTDRSAELRALTMERGASQVTGSTADLLDGFRANDRGSNGLGYLSAAVLQESDVVAYNRGTDGPKPKVQLVATYPFDGLFSQQAPYLVLPGTGSDPIRRQAAADFLAALRAPAGQAALGNAGFRGAGGAGVGFGPDLGVVPTLPATTPGPADAAALASARTFFDRVHQRGVTLAVMDTSGSMADPVPGTDQTKLDLARGAALAGLGLFADNDYLGLWAFSTHQDGAKGWKQLGAIAELDSKGEHGTHRDDLRLIAPTLRASGDTALYETALAAYQAMTKAYQPGRLNQVVLFTDGQNDTPDDPGSLTLPQLLTQLKTLYNPDKPVRIITVGYGKDADAQALKEISDATHAHSYLSRDPRDINNVFFDALVQNES